MENAKKRKIIAKLKRDLKNSNDRYGLIKKICDLQQEIMQDEQQKMPTLYDLRTLVEKDIEQENFEAKSPTDVKRIALKKAILSYYNDLEYDPESVIVDFGEGLRLRRDNKREDSTDLDFAPDYSKVYELYMDNVRELVRHYKLHKAEWDDAVDSGMPKGGAFEKQLIRLMKDYLKQLQ